MISRSIITSPADAAAYYSDLQKAAEYYGGETVPSQWLGQGAELQNLQGEVTQKRLTDQLQGRARDSTGERQLGVFRKGELQHRAGYDFTVSAPKSVSIEALAFDNKSVITAHNRAVKEAFDYLETNAAQSRINGKMIRTGNLTAASYQHVSSRAGDPQLHTHLLISNVTFDRNGKAYSLSSERLFEYRKTADSIYHNRLSFELQKLGYSVRHDRDGRVEIADYSVESIRDFSTRRQEIELALAARGIKIDASSHAARQAACLATRTDKNLPETRAAHASRWQAQAAALGLRAAAHSSETPEPPTARDALTEATQHLGERSAIWTERALHGAVSRFSGGRSTWSELSASIRAAEQRGELIRESAGTGPTRFTTAAARDLETQMISSLESGVGAHESVLTPQEFDRARSVYEATHGFALTREQAAAASQILTCSDRFQAVQGLAGTGKTTLLDFVRTAAESKGWRVVGHSNGASQAATLQRESGIEATTTAAHLLVEEGRVNNNNLQSIKELQIMDEASLTGQRDFSRVIEATTVAGARTVFLGDSRQHQAVEAGRAFEIAAKYMPTAILGRDSIRRQRTPGMQAAVGKLLDGYHDQAVKSIACVTVTQTQKTLPPDASRDDRRAAARADNLAVIQRVASDYAALTPEQRANTLVVTATNSDRERLNEAIRERLKSQGELDQGVIAQTLKKSNLTSQELRRASSFEPGQVVEVLADARRQELTRGSQWQVTGQVAGVLQVQDAAGHERVIDPSRVRLQAYDLDQRDLAIGDRLRWVENHRVQRADHPLEAGLRVRNGETATVIEVTPDRITLRCGDGEELKIDPNVNQKLDHAYVSTSHAAQGRTVDSVLIHHNTEAGTHSQREVYVNLTRARDSATFYTQNLDKAAGQSGLPLDKSAALDLVPDIPTPPDHPPGHDPDHGPEIR